MLGAGFFLVCLGIAGFWISGWLLALGGVIASGVALVPLNALVLAAAPERYNLIVLLQIAKWLLAFAVLGTMIWLGAS